LVLGMVKGEEIIFHKPVVYQQTAGVGKRQFIEGRYVIKGKNQVRFELARYDTGKLLVIDPILPTPHTSVAAMMMKPMASLLTPRAMHT